MYEALLSLRLQRVQPPESKKSITLHSCRPKACTISSLDAVFKFIQGWPIENGVALIKQTTSACRDIGNNSEKVASYFDLSLATEESLSKRNPTVPKPESRLRAQDVKDQKNVTQASPLASKGERNR